MKMWHEARRQERKIRGMLVDYRRRAERRRDFYEKIKADPTQFLQVHGRQCKIHLDPAVAAAADSSSAMMPWQGQADNLIDRFDVRAHLDFIQPPPKKEEEQELTLEERQLNYERYRIIAQNAFLGISEEKFLKQLHLEEQFGYTESKSKKDRTGGAAIGFNYEDGTGTSQQSCVDVGDEGSDENSDSDLDVDLSINVSKMDSLQAHDLNRHGHNFGMSSNDFYSFLTHDLEEAESYKLAKEEETEKALFSGRKSRRERRAHREKRLANRVISPPSYAAKESPDLASLLKSKSASRSPSPENAGKITYITSFGDEEDTPTTSKPTYADKVKYGRKRKSSSTERIVGYKKSQSKDRGYRRRRRSPSRSRSRRRSQSKSRSRRYSRSRSRSKRYSRSRSRSKRHSPSRSRSRRRSVSRSKSKRHSRSRSRDRHRTSRSSSRIKNRTYRYRRSSSSSSSSKPKSKSKSPVKRTRSSSSSSDRTVGIKQVSKLTKSKSKSKSLSPIKESPPKVIPRYYGRKKSDQSSSECDVSEDENTDNKESNSSAPSDKWTSQGNTGTAIKKSSTVNLSIQEKLKRKRQAMLAKQYKADKIAEQIKTEREKQEQQNRKEEFREMTIKLRRRQREKRHAYDSNRSSSSSSTPDSPSRLGRNSRPNSRSVSPKRRDDRERYKRREHRDKSRDQKGLSRDGSRDRERSNSKDRERNKRSDRSRERSRSKERNRSRDRNKSRERDRSRERNRSTERKIRDRSRDCNVRSSYASSSTHDSERSNRDDPRNKSDRNKEKCTSPSVRRSPKRYDSKRTGYKASDRTSFDDSQEERRSGDRRSSESIERPVRSLVDY